VNRTFLPPFLLTASPTDDETNRRNIALLIQLCWTAVIGQVGTIAFVHAWLGIPLPLASMAGVICALVTLNLASLVWIKYWTEIGSLELLLALMLDVAALKSLSGGATNPFTSLYLLQVTLGAVLLDSRSTWSLVTLTVVSFASFTGAYRPLELPHDSFSGPLNLHVAGMFIGFVLPSFWWCSSRGSTAILATATCAWQRCDNRPPRKTIPSGLACLRPALPH
jgi:two-component system sensor histidine kinase RegB